MNNFLLNLKNNPQNNSFEATMNVIDKNYNFTPTEFKNGDLINSENENNGSCKIFSFARMHDLSETETLQCFGDYYRKDVLENPNNTDHQNIRNFMKTGWSGISFSSAALTVK